MGAEKFYENVFHPYSGRLSGGLLGHLGDGLSWPPVERILACRAIVS